MSSFLLFIAVVCVIVATVSSFRPSRFAKNFIKSSQTQMSLVNPFTNDFIYTTTDRLQQNGFMLLADTSISEEEVLAVVGQTTDLPDPLYIVGAAFLIFLSVAVLQFSLGDLTKEVLKVFSIISV